MTRRSTSVIGGPRHAAAPPPPDAGALRQWTPTAVRELMLSLQLDAGQEAEAWKETARLWRIAKGLEKGNPAPGGERSKVWRESDAKGQGYWYKNYGTRYMAQEANEVAVLNKLAEADLNGDAGLRNHVAHFNANTDASKLTRRQVKTKCAGPNLEMWRDFTPCAPVGKDTLLLPLFVQPLFLAALTRQALIALHKLSAASFCHLDIKAGNLCLAFPVARDWRQKRGIATGRWDLKALPMRLIDFETSYAPSVARLDYDTRGHDGTNDYWSPYLRACFLRARAEEHGDEVIVEVEDPVTKKKSKVKEKARVTPHERQGILLGIDWGSDLWALGFLLHGWCMNAQTFTAQFTRRAAEHWGVDSSAHRTAQDTVSTLLGQLSWLSSFADALQAHERSPADAQLASPPARITPPHSRLWAELESEFKLGPGDRERKLDFQLIVPTTPLAVAKGSRLIDRAAMQARAAGQAGSAWALRHHRALLSATAATALAATAVQGHSAWAAAVAPTVGQWATASLAAQLQTGSSLQTTLAPLLLHAAGLLDSKLPTAIAVQALGQSPSLPTDGSTPAPATLRALRASNLRALTLMADAPDAVVRANDGPTPALLGHRLLLQAYQSGDAFEHALGGGHPPTEIQAHIGALARLHGRTAWPMAALLHLHLSTCYGAALNANQKLPRDSDHARLQPLVNSLLALPAVSENAFYRDSAQSYSRRWATGQDACLLPEGAPSNRPNP